MATNSPQWIAALFGSGVLILSAGCRGQALSDSALTGKYRLEFSPQVDAIDLLPNHEFTHSYMNSGKPESYNGHWLLIQHDGEDYIKFDGKKLGPPYDLTPNSRVDMECHVYRSMGTIIFAGGSENSSWYKKESSR